MPSSIGIGFSNASDGIIAAKDAAAQVRKQLGGGRLDLALVFYTSTYQPKDFLPVLFDALDHTRLIGSSTAGLILPEGIESHGIGIMAIRSDYIRFEVGHIAHLPFQDIFTAGKNMVANCITEYGTQSRKLFLFFIDSAGISVPDFIAGLKEPLGAAFPIFGAGSSNNPGLHKAYQLFQEDSLTGSVVGVLMGGSFHMGISQRHGWKPLGKPRLISDCAGPVIKTIDGKPARLLYEEFLGPAVFKSADRRWEEITVRYPLGLLADKDNEYIVRNVVNALDDGGVVCQDTVIKNAEVHLMLGGRGWCLQAVEEAAQEVKLQLGGRKPQFILVFDSFMRYRLLGRAVKEELKIIKKVLGDTPPVFGMFSANETVTGPLHPRENIRTRLQNGCIVIAAIC